MKVGTLIPGKQAATISPDASLERFVTEMRDRNIGALVVSQDGITVEGIVSERDVVRAMPGRVDQVAHLTVRDLMTTDVVTCLASTTCAELMSTMTERRIRHVPVVDENGALVSIVSIGDVVKAHIEEIDGEREALKTYITT